MPNAIFIKIRRIDKRVDFCSIADSIIEIRGNNEGKLTSF